MILFLPESTEGVAAGQTTAMDYENAADSTENNAETVASGFREAAEMCALGTLLIEEGRTM